MLDYFEGSSLIDRSESANADEDSTKREEYLNRFLVDFKKHNGYELFL